MEAMLLQKQEECVQKTSTIQIIKVRKEKQNNIELPGTWKDTLRKVKAQNVNQLARTMQDKQRKKSISTLVARGRQTKEVVHCSKGKEVVKSWH